MLDRVAHLVRRRYVLVAWDIDFGELEPPTPFRYWRRRSALAQARHLTILASCRHPTSARRPPHEYHVREIGQ